MFKSEDIKDLAAALAKAQGEMKGAVKDAKNPFYKSTYANLESVWHAIGNPISKNGLSIIQTTAETDKGTVLETTLLHLSGQWVSGSILVKPVKNDPPGLGSALTYYRRYALAAIAGVYSEDDDGNMASGKKEISKGGSPAEAFVGIPDEELPPFDNFPDEVNLKDQTFTIGKDMKGKKFSEQIKLPTFVNWVKSEVEHNLAKCHAEIKEFYYYAKAKGVLK